MDKKIKEIINYIKKLLKKDKEIMQIFFTLSWYDQPALMKEIDNCKIYLEKRWHYIDVVGLNKNEIDIINKEFGLYNIFNAITKKG